MGCDIHCYIETQRYPHSKEPWWPFNYYGLNPGRDYKMFTLLAGVRGYDDLEPVYAQRGLPNDLSWSVRIENQIFVCPEPDAEGQTDPETAARWVRHGDSKWEDDEHKWVTHPDWHSHSWLTTDEFEKVLKVYSDTKDEYGGVGPSYRAVLAAMKAFEDAGEPARLVFWFDN